MKNLVTNDWGVVGAYYRLYPGGVECELTYITEPGFETAKAFVKVPESQIEKYDRQKIAEEALSLATKQMKKDLKNLEKAIDKWWFNK